MDDRSRPTATFDVWRPIHYLGSKLRVVGPISNMLEQVDPRRGRLCDLFAGSGTVSVAMARERAVTAVDIQEYSRVLCSALLRPTVISRTEADQMKMRAIHGSLHEELRWAAEALIEFEANSLEEARRGNFNAICDLIEFGSIAAYEVTYAPGAPVGLHDAIQRTRKRLEGLERAVGSRSVALRHFGGVYFSYCQTVELAALLEMVTEQTGRLRHVTMAAVLSTASEIVNTVGKQFAQPLKPRDAKGKPKAHLVQRILDDRTASAFTVFSWWLDRYSNLPQSDLRHRIVRADYRDALANHCDNVSAVYADPPYTRDHYSRFYHVLETMCLGDDPPIATTHQSIGSGIGRGLYRVDRHQSPFCIKSQAPKAFVEMFDGVRRLGVPLVLSYSPLARTTKPRPRVLETDDLISIASKFFKRVELVSAGRVTHNKLNKTSMNSEVSHDAEIFLVCD